MEDNSDGIQENLEQCTRRVGDCGNGRGKLLGGMSGRAIKTQISVVFKYVIPFTILSTKPDLC